MKYKARKIPYSSVVGLGIALESKGGTIFGQLLMLSFRNKDGIPLEREDLEDIADDLIDKIDNE